MRRLSGRADRGSDSGKTQCGIELRYRYDDQAGTAGAVRGALDDLGERFLVLYGDTYLRIDYAAVAAASEGWPALMTVLRNEGRWDASNADFRDGKVVRYEKGAPGMSWIDYGLSVLTPEALGDEADLAQVFTRLAAAGQLAGYEATRALLRDRHARGARRDGRLPQWKRRVRSRKKLTTVTNAATQKNVISVDGSTDIAVAVNAY